MDRIIKQKTELMQRYVYCLNSLNISEFDFITMVITVSKLEIIPKSDIKYDEILKALWSFLFK